MAVVLGESRSDVLEYVSHKPLNNNVIIKGSGLFSGLVSEY